MTRNPMHPLPPAAVETNDSHSAARQPSAFWRSSFVQNILPLLSSLTVHAMILIIGVAAAQAIIAQVRKPPEPQIEHQTNAAVGLTVDAGPKTGPLFSAPEDGDPFRKFLQDVNPDAPDENGIARLPSQSLKIAADSGEGGGEGYSPIITVGLQGPGFGDRNGRGSAKHGLAGGEGGLQARWGLPGGGGKGESSPLFGPPTFGGGAARRLVYVCDASGSMLNRMATLKHELTRAVEGLRPIQSFGIVFFQDQRFDALNEQNLLPANPENKHAARKFLDELTTTGTTDPIPGLELAFRQRPQLVYLLTDGDFPDNQAVIRKIAELNKDKAVKVNTIAFLDNPEDSREGQFIEVLQQIARDNGGAFKLVLESDLVK